jgi:hypothetical protein
LVEFGTTNPCPELVDVADELEDVEKVEEVDCDGRT